MLRKLVDVIEIDEVGVALYVLVVVDNLREETAVLHLSVIERNRRIEVLALLLIGVVLRHDNVFGGLLACFI